MRNFGLDKLKVSDRLSFAECFDKFTDVYAKVGVVFGDAKLLSYLATIIIMATHLYICSNFFTF